MALLLLLGLSLDLYVNMKVLHYGCLSYNLLKFDKIQKLAGRMSSGVFPALQSCRAVSAAGILCKLLDLRGRGSLQPFCSNSVSPAIQIEKLD